MMSKTPSTFLPSSRRSRNLNRYDENNKNKNDCINETYPKENQNESTDKKILPILTLL
jgi:hypothetical protein